MNQMVEGLENIGIEIPDEIKNAIGILQGMSAILTGISTTLLAIEAISAADTIIPFAHGGKVPHAASGYFVPGTRRSTDTTPILANAGEVVLNRAQVGGLKTALEGAGTRNVNVSGVLRGTDIVIAVDRSLQATGRGELVTWGK
jgi:hypothetical protein